MAELRIPDGTIADKNKDTEIIISDDRVVRKGTQIRFPKLDDLKLEVDGFYEVRDDEVNTWVQLNNTNGSDIGVCGVSMLWQEIAERLEYGDAKIE